MKSCMETLLYLQRSFAYVILRMYNNGQPRSECQATDVCAVAASNLLLYLEAKSTSNNGSPLFPLEPWEPALQSSRFCSGCRPSLIASAIAAEQDIWENLPNIMKVEGWDGPSMPTT